MRGSGRTPPSGFGILPRLLYLSAHLALVTGTDYGIPIEIKLWDTGRTPLAHMVDVTNGFGLKVLAEHNFLNDNNIAFSPYGLMGILVALYEGVDGESSFQIQRGMQLPWNRNVMRIGFRDIHRTLKTYFIPEEGFLAGLALNNENVTFNENYKKILRFYGFDLENDQLPTFSPGTNDTANGTAMNDTMVTTTAAAVDVTSPATTAAAMTTENTANREELSTTPIGEETTLNPNAETIGEVDLREPTSTTVSSAFSNDQSTTEGPDNPSTAEQNPTSTEQTIIASETVTIERTDRTTQITSTISTTEQAVTTAEVLEQATTTIQIISTEQTTTTEQATSTLEQAATTAEQTTSADTTLLTTLSASTAAETSSATTSLEVPSTTAVTETIGTQTLSTATLTDEPTVNNEIDAMTTRDETNIAESTSTDTTTPSTTTNGNPETESVSSANTETQTEQLPTSVTDSSSTATEMDSTTASTLETLDRRKRSIVDFIFANPPYVDDYLVYKSYNIGPELTDFDDQNKMFLVNGLRNVQVTYMQYDTILEYAYLPHLGASALRLPLDSDRYYLLVVLPTHGGVAELGRLLARMARESDLSDIYAALRPRRVRALVPSFTVKGHVTLTTDLQKLGLRDVFEPRQHDFTPMTRQPAVYVRSIEQAVSVAIRKYRPDEHKHNRYESSRQPVKFRATYPFLYFVMDASIHVALMAGKMVDPLNTRIL